MKSINHILGLISLMFIDDDLITFFGASNLLIKLDELIVQKGDSFLDKSVVMNVAVIKKEIIE